MVMIILNKVCLLQLKLEHAKMCCSLKYWANAMIHFLQKDIKTPKFNLHTNFSLNGHTSQFHGSIAVYD